jgi:hypothetical protein
MINQANRKTRTISKQFLLIKQVARRKEKSVLNKGEALNERQGAFRLIERLGFFSFLGYLMAESHKRMMALFSQVTGSISLHQEAGYASRIKQKAGSKR